MILVASHVKQNNAFAVMSSNRRTPIECLNLSSNSEITKTYKPDAVHRLGWISPFFEDLLSLPPKIKTEQGQYFGDGHLAKALIETISQQSRMQKNERAKVVWENMKIQLSPKDHPKKITSYHQTIYENNSFKWKSLFENTFLEGTLVDIRYQKYLFTYFPSIYARFCSSKHPDTGLTFDTKCVHTTFPSTILHHSAAVVGFFSGISSFWINWKVFG